MEQSGDGKAEVGSLMTEEEWLAAVHPGLMLELVRGLVSDRKMRLFACACYRRLWNGLTDQGRAAVIVGEDYADNLRSRERLVQEANDAYWHVLGESLEIRGAASIIASVRWLPLEDAYEAACRVAALTQTEFANCEFAQAQILRHIVGNPFPLDPPSLHVPSTIRDLAETVYQQNKGAIPPLHDALLDAGLTELADHFRDTSTWHPKGCWVIDLLTGRT